MIKMNDVSMVNSTKSRVCRRSLQFCRGMVFTRRWKYI